MHVLPEGCIPSGVSIFNGSLPGWEQAVFVLLISIFEQCGSAWLHSAEKSIELDGDVRIQQLANSTYGAIEVASPTGGFIWKNLLTGKHNGWNELAVYRISRQLGFSQVPAIAVCQIEHQPGTAAQFIRNAKAPHDIQFDASGRKRARSFLQGPAFPRQAADMILLDTIIGNKDRHAGNWLIDVAGKKLWWIDHGSVRWADSEKTLLDRLKKLGYTLKALGVSENRLCQVMGEIRARLEICVEERLEKWLEIRRQDWDDLFLDLPEQAGNFQRQPACDFSWAAFQKITNEKGVFVTEADFQWALRKINKWQPTECSGT